MFDVRSFALDMLKKSPALRGNRNASEYIKVIESGDNAKGEEIANNILRTYGISREDALKQARAMFRL